MPRHEPRQYNKKFIKMVVFIVLLCVGLVSGYVYMNQEEDSINNYKLDNLTHEETKSKLEKEYTNTFSVSDYLFYGECLNLFQEAYQLDALDEIVGKSLILKDITSNKEYSFVLGTSVDTQIVLSSLHEGMYEVFIIEDLVEKRVVYTTSVQDEIKTVTNENGNCLVSLIADEAYFEDKKINVSENYMFLQVEETTLEAHEYDIILDPAGNDHDFNIWTVNEGNTGNGLTEYIESYTAAVLLKEALEDKGLKVLITREQDEVMNSYGDGGRLHQAYQASAKYYFKLGFSSSELNYSGLDISYSAHTSGRLATQVLYELEKNSNIKLCSVYSLNTDGLIAPIVIEGIDGKIVYDQNLIIRESGGKATGASKFSENADVGTGFFAKDNPYGMQTLSINLGYLTSDEDVTYWVNNKEEYMGVISDALYSYIGISND